MLKFILLSVSLACGLIIVNGIGEKVLGPGKWYIINMMKCEEDASMPLKFDVARRKINRTHDGFNVKFTMDEVLDSSFAIRIEICKFVDGGCKPYQIMAEDSAERFIKRYSKENFEKVLTLAGIDPPTFPVPTGSYEVTSFMFDYNDLPENGQYGRYGAKAYLMKDAVDKECLELTVRFTEDGEEE